MNKTSNNKRLGIGLEQLFSNERLDFDGLEKKIIDETPSNDIVEIPIDEIRSNPYQPRKTFDGETLNELADSIREHGVFQPIIVKKSIKGYELVAGERRTRASKIAGLKTIPAIIRDFNDEEMMEIALVENIQRENLNPIEEALAYDNIIKSTNMTQENIAIKFGKSRSYITNMLGLLKLPEETKKLVESGKLSASHARTLSKMEDKEEINKLANKIVNENINVREIEDLTRKINLPKTKKDTPSIYKIYEDIMQDKIGTKIKIKNKKIEIPFDSDKDLERILEILNIEIEGE
ncbi:MAG: ParB/RepB/Spo0J family partition protein [Bacilli bacterium]|nr:ParB/RepB/Spo0J family partition protein [Bacilli bacterium]